MAKLIITEGGRDKVYEIVDEEFTIGSAAEADLQLKEPQASPIHCAVKKMRGGFRLLDMETRAGTRVNGKPVNDHVLANGDTVEIGDVKITYIGKGPARVAAAPAPGRRGPKLESRKSYYRHESWDSKVGPWGVALIVIGAGALLVGVFFLMLATTDPDTAADKFQRRLNEANHQLKTYKSAAVPTVRKLIAEMEEMDLDPDQRKKVAGLRKRVEEAIAVRETTDLEHESRPLWVQIHNTRLFEPNNTEKIRDLAKTYLARYPGTEKEEQVREILASVEDAGDNPQQSALGRLESAVTALFNQKEYRQAYELIENADPELKTLYAEELEAMATRVRKRSRQVLGPRKNDVRHELRLGNRGEARRLVESMFDKLVLETIEAYLLHPDKGYENPETARLELETQDLMKEVMQERKARR